jgi:very-short-patch-repair endonuclease
LLETLRQCVLTEPEHVAVAILDSALRSAPIGTIDLAIVQRSLPQRHARVFSLVDRAAESGTESILRVLLAQVGVVARPQAAIPFSDLGRVDLLVGDRLVIECDSEAHHGGAGSRLRDLRRDAALAALGFIVLRFDFAQVMFDSDSVLAAVQAYVDRGLHRDLSGG